MMIDLALAANANRDESARRYLPCLSAAFRPILMTTLMALLGIAINVGKYRRWRGNYVACWDRDGGRPTVSRINLCLPPVIYLRLTACRCT